MVATRRLMINDFRSGLDLREGTFLDPGERPRCSILENLFVGRDRRLHRRHPRRKLDVAIPDEIQGFTELDSGLYAFKQKGIAATITGGDAGDITVLDWDLPPEINSGDEWELLDAINFNNVIVALIRHEFDGPAAPGGTVPAGVDMDRLVRLHVWDSHSEYKTWVSDPYAPSNFSQGLTAFAETGSDEGNVYHRNWAPRMTIVGSRLAIVGPTGDTHLSKPGAPRVWNPLTQSDIEIYGEPVAFVARSTAVVSEYRLPFLFADLFIEDRGAGSGAYYDTTSAALRYHSYVLKWYQDANREFLRINEHLDRYVKGTSPSGATTYTIDEDADGYAVVKLYDPGGVLYGKVLEFRAVRAKSSDDYDPTGDVSFSAVAVDFAAHPTDDGTYEKWASYLQWSATFGVNLPTINEDYLIALRTSTAFNTFETRSDPPHLAAGSDEINLASGAVEPFWNGDFRHHHYITNAKYQIDGAGGGAAVSYEIKDDYIWHVSRFDREVDISGGLQTGAIGTAFYSGGEGASVSGIIGLRDTLLVQTRRNTQMWQVPADIDGVAFRDRRKYGSGKAGYSPLEEFDKGLVMSQSVLGWRAWSAAGDASRALADQNIGEAVEGLGDFDCRSSCYWIHQGAFVAMGLLDGDLTMVTNHFSTESEMAPWATWTFTDATAVPSWVNAGVLSEQLVNRGSMIPIDDRLYWRSGGSVYYLDASASSNLHDDNEVEDQGYVSKVQFHRLRPFTDARAVMSYIDLDVTGQCSLSSVLASHSDEVVAGPTVYGITFDTGRVRMSAEFYAIGLIIESQDSSGFDINEIGLHVRPKNRTR